MVGEFLAWFVVLVGSLVGLIYGLAVIVLPFRQKVKFSETFLRAAIAGAFLSVAVVMWEHFLR